MSISYRFAIREIAKRVNAITGATASAMATNYTASPLTTTEVDDPVYNLDLIKDVVIDVESRIVQEIASAVDPNTGIGNHYWRNTLETFTGVTYHGETFPQTASNNKPIVGVPGICYVGSVMSPATAPQIIMTPASPERISQYLLNTGIYTNQPYLYCIHGATVMSTLGNISTGSPVQFKVVWYDRSQAAAVITNNGVMYVPEPLLDCVVAGGVQALLIEDEYQATVAYYRDYYNKCLQLLRQGATSMPGMPIAGAMTKQ